MGWLKLSLIPYWKVIGGVYLGWGIGANDSANIFGTAVATNSVRYRTAIILIAIFAMTGAVLQGPALFDSVKFQETALSPGLALVATFASAVAIMIVTILGIPASTSQAAIGGLVGIAILSSGWNEVDWNSLGKMAICWVGTPIGGAIIGYLLYRFVNAPFRAMFKNPQRRDRVIRVLLIASGSYGAYSLGANNVVVTTVAYYQADMFGPHGAGAIGADARLIAATIGGLSIALGALTYSRNVMETIGKKITVLDPFSALLAIFAHSLTLQIFTYMHVPVSSSQAIVGGVIGVGMVKGAKTISLKQLARIFVGWIATPIASAIAAYVIAWTLL